MSEAVRAFTIGSVECRVLPDGVMAYEPESLYAGLSPEDTGPAVSQLLDERGLMAVPYHPLLVQTAGGPALIDTGAGPALAEESGEPVGRLPHALGAAGVAAEDVALVLLSHAHPDHIGGLTTKNGTGRRLVFPRARHVISRAEYQYWTSGQIPGDFAWMGELARQHLIPIEQAGLLDLVEGEQEVAPGIHVVPAPGHTPGHMAIWLTSGSQYAIFVADAVLGETNFAHPDWTSVFDTDRAQAARTRRQLLDAAAHDTAIIAGYHLWGPGMAERHAGAYRWSPLRAAARE
jgi:glyoxylase-like metal-dependent hydrolase (beta-lactamase superfamily II)